MGYIEKIIIDVIVVLIGIPLTYINEFLGVAVMIITVMATTYLVEKRK